VQRLAALARMANAEHEDILRQGALVLHNWQNTHNFPGIDLSDIRLWKNTLNQDSPSLNLRNAKLARAHIEDQGFSNADFQDADLTEASLREVGLNNSNFLRAKLNGTLFNNCRLPRSNFREICSSHTRFLGSFTEADFTDSTFTNCAFGGTFNHAKFVNVKFESCVFQEGCGLPDVDFSGSRGLETCFGLHLCKATTQAKNLDKLIVPWFRKFISWEHLRSFGKLPMFTPSVFVLLFLFATSNLLSLYNSKAASLQKQLTRFAQNQNAEISNFVGNLPDIPIYRFSKYAVIAFFATVALSIAASIYYFACPAEVKEFSRQRWVYELNKGELNYLGHSWRYKWARVVCFSMYTVGGVLALWVIGERILYVYQFVTIYGVD
jgi:uncharacterized protein YjbI with pentapeptide repeats